jgi:hypothetical protein
MDLAALPAVLCFPRRVKLHLFRELTLTALCGKEIGPRCCETCFKAVKSAEIAIRVLESVLNAQVVLELPLVIRREIFRVRGAVVALQGCINQVADEF